VVQPKVIVCPSPQSSVCTKPTILLLQIFNTKLADMLCMIAKSCVITEKLAVGFQQHITSEYSTGKAGTKVF